MKCPKCRYEKSRVIDKRNNGKEDSIYRRRECTKCGHRWTTYEIKNEFITFDY